MNTLRQAVQEYLDLRRSLGFKLKDAGKALPDFVAFMERHRASFITQALVSIAGIKEPGIFGVMEPGGAAWIRLERGSQEWRFFPPFSMVDLGCSGMVLGAR